MKEINVSRINEINTMLEIVSKGDEYKENSKNGLVILLNGEWGSGKTVFLKELENEINKKYSIELFANYNSFENDFYANPYIPFFATIDDKVDLKGDFTKLINATNKMIKSDVLALSYTITRGFIKSKFGVDIDDIRKKSKIFLDEYNKDKNYLKEFNDFCNLKNKIKKKMKDICKDKTHVLIIDELDRCNPNFAINTLEIIKHFFDIENLVVIIAVDKAQLQESAKTIFGQNMNSEIYFSKFFDYQFNLSTIDFYEIVDISSLKDSKGIINYASYMFGMLNISLRDSKKIFKEFMSRYDDWDYIQSRIMLFLFILKYTDLYFYNVIMRGEYSSYKYKLENDYNPVTHKYLTILAYTFQDVTLDSFLASFTSHMNVKYIDKKFINKEFIGNDNELKLQYNTLKTMIKYIPQVKTDITYKETIKRIIR